MLPLSNKPISEIAREEDISEGTLYSWRKAARAQGRLMPEAIPALRVGSHQKISLQCWKQPQ